MCNFCLSKSAYLHLLLVSSLLVISNVNTGNPVIGTGYLFFHYWPLVNQEPAIIVGMVYTLAYISFDHMVKIHNPVS